MLATKTQTVRGVYEDTIAKFKKDSSFGGWKMVFHYKPHLDEIVAAWLLTIYGHLKFGKIFGVTKGQTPRLEELLGAAEFWKKGGSVPDCRTWADHVREGYILLGCAHGSLFDEHASDGKLVVENECCATLVAQFLGIQKRPEIRAILRAVKSNDTSGANFATELARVISAKYRTRPEEDHHAIIIDAWRDLNALRKESMLFGPAIRFMKNSRSEIHRRKIQFGDKEITLIAGETDLHAFGKAARSRGADIVIQRFSSGHVNIMANQNLFQISRTEAHREICVMLKRLGVEAPDNDATQQIVNTLPVDPKAKARVDEALRRVISELRISEAQQYWDVSSLEGDDSTPDEVKKLIDELRALEGDVPMSHVPQHLRKVEGSIPQVRQWFYHGALASIFNRSETAPDQTPTCLSNREIVNIVVKAFTTV